MRQLTSKALARHAALAALKIKAQDVKILDLTKLGSFADYFIIAGGSSDRQVEAIANSIELEMKKLGRKPIGSEGYQHAQWIILDYGDIVAHVFYRNMREVYDIEKLWSDARATRVRSSRPASKKKGK